MRATTTISFPDQKALHTAKCLASKRGFKSFSSYLTKLIKIDSDEENIISEDMLLKYSQEAEEDYKKGQCIQVNSLRDLIK